MTYKIERGVTPKPVKAVAYGVEGVGKTTFGAAWPGAVFIDVEDGSGHYDVARFPRPTLWTELIAEVLAAVDMDEVGTLVIDTIDAAEALCVAHVLRKKKWKGIEDAGYGKGYTYASEQFSKLLDALDKVVEAGKNVLLLAHAQIKKFEQPDELGAYDRWELKLSKKDAPLVKEWCDLLLFANYKTDVMTSDDGKKTKASGGKKRVMYASHTAAWDAKNRLGLRDSMPFDFAEIADKVPTDIKPAEQPFVPEDEAEAQAGAQAAGDAAVKAASKASSKSAAKAVDKPSKRKDGPSLEEMDSYLHEIANGNMNAKPPEFEEVTEPEFAQLHQLMADYQVSEAQLRDAVGSRKNNDYTDATPIGDYSIEFVRNTLLKHWEKIVATVKERGELYKDIPF